LLYTYLHKRKSFTTVRTAVLITDGIYEHFEGIVASVKKKFETAAAVYLNEGNKQIKLQLSSSSAHYNLNYH